MNKIKAGIVGLVVASFAFAFNAQADTSYAFGNVGAGYDFHGWHDDAGLSAGFQSMAGTDGTLAATSGGVLGGTHLNHGAANADGATSGNAFASNDGHTAVAVSSSGSNVGSEIHGSGISMINGTSSSVASAILPHHHWW